jgi:thymidylate kinase
MKHLASNVPSASTLLVALFEAWTQHAIPWLVLRNHEQLPDVIGNDVDLLLAARHRATAETILADVASQHGWRIHNEVEHACRAIYLHHETTLEQLHLDLTYVLTWHGLEFIDASVLLAHRERRAPLFVAHPAHEAAVTLSMGLYYQGQIKPKYRGFIQEGAKSDKRLFLEALTLPGGEDALCRDLYASIMAGDWDAVASFARAWRMKRWRTGIKKPGLLLVSLMREGRRFLRRLLRPPGMVLVLLGPDGCGKSSVAAGLGEKLKKTFYPAVSMHAHWKPMPADEQRAPTKDPHGRPPRPAWKSICFFVYHWLHFVLGWWVHVEPRRMRNGLVIIDRYYYDFFVDPLRYRLALPQWILRAAFVFVHKPDLVVGLDVAPEVAQHRKREVADAECARQCTAYRCLVEKLLQGVLVDANRTLDEVVTDVQHLVLKYMVARRR